MCMSNQRNTDCSVWVCAQVCIWEWQKVGPQQQGFAPQYELRFRTETVLTNSSDLCIEQNL